MSNFIIRLELIENRNLPKPEGAYLAIIADDGTDCVTGRGSRFKFSDRQAFSQWQAEQNFINDMSLLVVDAVRNAGEQPTQL